MRLGKYLTTLYNRTLCSVLFGDTSVDLPTVNPTTSSITLDVSSIDDDGVDYLTATITLIEAVTGNPIVGYSPSVYVDPTTGVSVSHITQTNGSGVCTARISCTSAGTGKIVHAAFNGIELDDAPTFDVVALAVFESHGDVSSLPFLLGRYGVADR